jgi:hypothetical protein
VRKINRRGRREGRFKGTRKEENLKRVRGRRRKRKNGRERGEDGKVQEDKGNREEEVGTRKSKCGSRGKEDEGQAHFDKLAGIEYSRARENTQTNGGLYEKLKKMDQAQGKKLN